MSHIHEKVDFVVDVFIVHGNKVLLRMHDKYNKWLPVGGHIELHEDPIEAVYREVKEESGLGIEIVGGPVRETGEGRKVLIPPAFLGRHHINETHDHVAMYYVAKALTTEIKPAPSEKPVEFKWFSAEELTDPQYNVPSDIQIYAAQALKLIK
jgi:8-oxo-dGTP diphosphatase